jgi:hypothetical protein
LVVNRQSGEIICTAHAEGSRHDFKLYQESIGHSVCESILFQGDSGYLGILKLHKNSELPKKKPKGGELTLEEKLENRRISRERVFIENVIAKFKVFKIFSNKYRNRRKRYELRTALICGIINYEKPK